MPQEKEALSRSRLVSIIIFCNMLVDTGFHFGFCDKYVSN